MIGVYTSCSLNYLPRARILAKTLKQHSVDSHITLILNDLPPGNFYYNDEPFDEIIQVQELLIRDIYGWIFKHDIMELNTAVKGIALKHLIDKFNFEYYFYFDPDCYIQQDINSIIKLLDEDKSIGLTPHICTPEDSAEGVLDTEISCLKHGIYNLGFLAVKNDNNGRVFVDWWADRLLKHCYNEPERGLFTDQRWVDLAPAIFDFIQILKQPELNVASWNFNSRKSHITNNELYVNDRKMVFYHFSGITNGSHENIRLKYQSDSNAYKIFEDKYNKLLVENGQNEFSDIDWSYGKYENGVPVQQQERIYYRNDVDIQEIYKNPFQCFNVEKSFYDYVKNKKVESNNKPLINFKKINISDFIKLIIKGNINKRKHSNQSHLELDKFIRLFDLDNIKNFNNNSLFDPIYYLSKCRERNICYTQKDNVFEHYISVGSHAKISPIPYFDEEWYLLANRDVRNAVNRNLFLSGYHHYLLYGMKEERDPGPDFSEKRYHEKHPYVKEAIAQGTVLSGFHHFLTNLG